MGTRTRKDNIKKTRTNITAAKLRFNFLKSSLSFLKLDFSCVKSSFIFHLSKYRKKKSLTQLNKSKKKNSLNPPSSWNNGLCPPQKTLCLAV